MLVINLYATYRPRSRLASYLPALRRIKQAGGGDDIKGLEGFEAAVRAAASDGAFRCGAFGLAAAPGAPRAAGLAGSPTVCGPQPPASLPPCPDASSVLRLLALLPLPMVLLVVLLQVCAGHPARGAVLPPRYVHLPADWGQVWHHQG